MVSGIKKKTGDIRHSALIAIKEMVGDGNVSKKLGAGIVVHNYTHFTSRISGSLHEVRWIVLR